MPTQVREKGGVNEFTMPMTRKEGLRSYGKDIMGVRSVAPLIKLVDEWQLPVLRLGAATLGQVLLPTR